MSTPLGTGTIDAIGQSQSGQATHLVINATFDSSLSGLPADIQAGYQSAVQTAIQFYETTFSNPVTINITFGFGEVGGTPIVNFTGESRTTAWKTIGYSQLYNTVQSAEGTSPVQVAAAASLPVNDPTGGAQFVVANAEAKALGVEGATTTPDGYVGLNSSFAYSWTQDNIISGTHDAVGTIEHEIAEVMGRTDLAGSGGRYRLLDLFRYTAADGLATDPIGAPAGAIDQPFAAGYSASAYSYFSYDGKTVTLLYDTPAEVTAGEDVADWANTVDFDTYSSSAPGVPRMISPTDLEEMNVLGWTLASGTAVTISGISPGQSTTDSNAVAPFASVTIADPTAGQAETVAVTMSAAANGKLTDAVGSFNPSTGVYTVAGSAAAVTAAVDGLLFIPAVGSLTPGQTASTGFTIKVTDTAGLSASDNTTSVTATKTLLGGLSLTQQLELIYIAYFNRAADSAGFNFWQGQNAQAQGAGQSAAVALSNIANAFAPQPETIAHYPFLGTANGDLNTPAAQAGLSGFVSNVYQNLFGHAPDPTGASYWAAQITSGAVGLGAAALAIANGATGTDAIEIENKVTVALDFTTRTATAGLGLAVPLPASFVTASDAVLNGIDGKTLNDASVAAGMAATTAFISANPATQRIANVAGDAAIGTDANVIPVTGANLSVGPNEDANTMRFFAAAGDGTPVPGVFGPDWFSGLDPGAEMLTAGSVLAVTRGGFNEDVASRYLTGGTGPTTEGPVMNLALLKGWIGTA